MYNNSINRYGNPNATQGFIWEEISWSTRLLERKKQQQSRVFYGVIFYVYTNADNKGDEFRRNKNMEIQSGGEKMRHASGQQGVVVLQNNGKGKTKKGAARANLFFANEKKNNN